MVDLVTIDGQRATPYMAYQLRRLKADFRARFNLEIYAVSGIRLDWEQIQIFLARYVKANEVRGRYVYDTRVWNGVRYYRISNAGTVAVPGTSNHEIQGDNAAWDFADSGSDAGVSRAGSERSNWLRANAWRYDLEPEGFNFGEAWHYKAKKIFSAVPAGSSSGSQPAQPVILEEDEMLALRIKAPNGTQHLCTLGDGVFRHMIFEDDPERMKNIIRQDDLWTDITLAELDRTLWTHGVDTGANVWRIVGNNEFQVFNPVDGSWRSGNMWSATNARFAELRKQITGK